MVLPNTEGVRKEKDRTSRMDIKKVKKSKKKSW